MGKKKVKDEKKLFLVETISMFRMRYVVNAKNAEHAMDEVAMNNGNYNDDWKEFSQHHVDECITSAREISESEYLKQFDEDNDYLISWSKEHKLSFINDINYNKDQK